MADLLESTRRKPGARGRRVDLADGHAWMLAEPTFRAGSPAMFAPDVAASVDQIHERVVLGEEVELKEIFALAGELLLANYQLTPDELASLVEVAPGPEAEALAESVLAALFCPEDRSRTYTDWVRASFLANGLASAEVPASAVGDVMTVLLATGRTVPPSQFIDACRSARDRDSREHLV